MPSAVIAETPAAADVPEAPVSNTDSANPRPAETPACACAGSGPKPALKRKPKPVVAAAASPAAPAKPAAAGEASVKPVREASASILGKKLQSLDGDDLGRVVDILADAHGRVRIAIVDYGGFLGVGNRRIAVDWSLLKFEPGNTEAPVIFNADKRNLQGIPEYKGTDKPLALMAPAAPSPAPATSPPTVPK